MIDGNRAYENPIDALARSIHTWRETWAGKMDAIYRGMEALQTRTKPWIEGLASLQTKAKAWAEGFEEIASRIKSLDFAAALKALERNAQTNYHRYCVLLLKNEWPPVQDVEITFADELLDHRRKLRGPRFTAWLDRQLVTRYQADRTSEILKSWEARKCLTSRIEILRQAVASHQRGDFCTAVPAFLIVIEGLLADLYSHTGWTKGEHIRQYAKKLTKGSPGMYGDGRFLRRFMAHVVLQDFRRGQTIPKGLSRHAILHGAKTDYGTDVHSLKAILTIELLSSLAQFMTRRGDSRFHVVGCPRIRNPSRFVTYYATEEEPRSRGFKTCVACKTSAN